MFRERLQNIFLEASIGLAHTGSVQLGESFDGTGGGVVDIVSVCSPAEGSLKGAARFFSFPPVVVSAGVEEPPMRLCPSNVDAADLPTCRLPVSGVLEEEALTHSVSHAGALENLARASYVSEKARSSRVRRTFELRHNMRTVRAVRDALHSCNSTAQLQLHSGKRGLEE
mmetsp:Transcript_12071/g.20424  ORF Transcript_12071/g.20424 Transcript_12071/m.20424 type:complete len:170 (+) Transcript_12071:1722-2231(+)